MAQYKEWGVALVVTTEHEYTVVARTAEEAVDIAEQLYDDGDEGTITSVSIDTADAVYGSDSEHAEFAEDEGEFES